MGPSVLSPGEGHQEPGRVTACPLRGRSPGRRRRHRAGCGRRGDPTPGCHDARSPARAGFRIPARQRTATETGPGTPGTASPWPRASRARRPVNDPRPHSPIRNRAARCAILRRAGGQAGENIGSTPPAGQAPAGGAPAGLGIGDRLVSAWPSADSASASTPLSILRSSRTCCPTSAARLRISAYSTSPVHFPSPSRGHPGDRPRRRQLWPLYTVAGFRAITGAARCPTPRRVR